MSTAEHGKRRFRDEHAKEWWAYQVDGDSDVEGARRALIFYCPEEQRRERLAWPDGLADLDGFDDRQLRALLPIGEDLPEQPELKVRLRPDAAEEE
jgi:hypothetical protein